MLHHVASCCMMLNEVWFPSNIWCNIFQYFFCSHVWTTKLHSFGRVLQQIVALAHAQQLIFETRTKGKLSQHSGSSLITTIRVCTTQFVAFVWPRSPTPCNKVEFHTVERSCFRLAGALDSKQHSSHRFWHLHNEDNWALEFLPLEHTVRHANTKTGPCRPSTFIVFPPPLWLRAVRQ